MNRKDKKISIIALSPKKPREETYHYCEIHKSQRMLPVIKESEWEGEDNPLLLTHYICGQCGYSISALAATETQEVDDEVRILGCI